MVTRSEWIESVLSAWDGELCPHCGRPHPAHTVDEGGTVWSYCPYVDRDIPVAREHWPDKLDPEPVDPSELPF